MERVDFRAKVRGSAKFLADMRVTGLCHGKILRSPVAHGRLRRVDVTGALKVPGVVAVLTGEDLLKERGIDPFYGPVFKDQTIVAVDKVRHVGDPVAAVAALHGRREGATELVREHIDWALAQLSSRMKC